MYGYRIIQLLTLCVVGTCIRAQCPGRTDLVIAVPGSEKVPGQEFFPFERFLINLMSFFNINEDGVNVGLILYGKEPIPISWPQPSKSIKQINTRITLMSQRLMYNDRLNGGNDVASAINMMRHMFNNPTGYPVPGPRPDVKRIGVLFTYDSVDSEDQARVIEAASDIHNEGVVMYAVGKGSSGPEFASIGSDYCKSFSMGRFIDGLPSLLAFLGSSICTEMDPVINVTAINCFPQLYQRKEPSPVQCSPKSVIFEDPENFRYFYHCLFSKPVQLYQRKEPSPVQCSPKSIIFEDPENCAYFYHCLFSKPVREKCPFNMLYDPRAMSCNWKDFVSCYSDIVCPEKDGLFPHPSDCAKYVNCFDFRPYIQSCPQGLWFDATTRGCESAHTVACPVM